FRVRLCVSDRDGRGVAPASGCGNARAGGGAEGCRQEEVDAWVASERRKASIAEWVRRPCELPDADRTWVEPPQSGVALKVRTTWELSTTAVCHVNKAAGQWVVKAGAVAYWGGGISDCCH